MNNIRIFCLEAECKIWEDQMEGEKILLSNCLNTVTYRCLIKVIQAMSSEI